MAEQIKKDNRGYLYPNSNKNKPTQPDYTGTIIVDGKEQKLAAWENTSTDGKKYLSIIVSPLLTPEQQAQFKRTDEPQEAPNNNNNNAKENNAKEKEDYYNNFSSDLEDDLDQILKNSDDDNPFN